MTSIAWFFAGVTTANLLVIGERTLANRRYKKMAKKLHEEEQKNTSPYSNHNHGLYL